MKDSNKNLDIRNWDQRLLDQVKMGWDNYRRLRIDLSTARNNEIFYQAGEFIYVEKVSNPSANAKVKLNRDINADLELWDGVEIKTLFSQIFISNDAQAGQWLDLLIGCNFEYKKKVIDCPQFGVILWPKTIAEIPPGWALCDGNNGTPDMRDRFVVGAGSSYALGATGGGTQHNHYFGATSGQAGAYNYGNSGTAFQGTPPTHTHWVGGNTENRNHLPPYRALYFIMKL